MRLIEERAAHQALECIWNGQTSKRRLGRLASRRVSTDHRVEVVEKVGPAAPSACSAVCRQGGSGDAGSCAASEQAPAVLGAWATKVEVGVTLGD